MTKSKWKTLYGDARWYIRLEKDYYTYSRYALELPNSDVQQVIDMVLASRLASHRVKPAFAMSTNMGDDYDVPF